LPDKRVEAIERQGRRCAVQGQPFVAAQLPPLRIADRGDDAEPVERAAQDDDE
jgi:hypothetical protein